MVIKEDLKEVLLNLIEDSIEELNDLYIEMETDEFIPDETWEKYEKRLVKLSELLQKLEDEVYYT